jgi:hypothetical protein
LCYYLYNQLPMDLQTVLLIILGILTVNLVVVGVYVVLVLRDFRETIKKATEVLDDVGQMTGVAAGPVTTLAGIFAGVTESVKAIKSISGLMDKGKGK